MKKLISVFLVAVMLLSMAACVPFWQQADPTEPTDEPTNPKPTAPSTPSDPTEGPTAPPEDYYSFGPEEMIIAKAGVTYAKHDSQIDGKDVYVLTSQGWNGEIWAEHTSHYLNDEVICTPNEKREDLIYKQYKYAAITFQLSEGAQIGLYHTVPVITEDFKGEMVGLILKAGGTLTHNPNYLDVYSDRFAIFTEGKQIQFGDSINAGQWYTYVCELHLDADKSLYGPDSYVNVSMTNGNSKPVYVSEVRFYTNDTYLTDYVTESTDPEPTDPEPTAPLADYVEMDATELVTYKPSTDNYTNQGEVFGRNNVYGATLLANWTVEVVAKNTAAESSMPNANSGLADWTAVRKNFKDNGYQYIAIDFALSEGATVRSIGCVPPDVEGGKVATTGLTFTDGQPLAWAATCKTDEQKSYFAVYSEGKEVAVGDTIEAGKWYTVVIKLLVNGNEYSQGEDGWSCVSFNVGNGKMIYFSTVRYYTNDTYKTDYEKIDYVEMDATELVSYKTGKENAYTNQGEVFGRTDVYGAELLANWSVELMAKNTAAATTYAGSPFADWNAVRQNYKDNGYQYIAIDFALSEGATVRAIGCVPPEAEGGNVATTGITFTDGQPMAWSANTKTEEQRSYFAVYCEGKEVAIGDPIEAGKWYTVVIKLLVNGDEYGQGKDGWSSVAFNVGNGKMIYFSTVRYYTNDTYKTDYVTETTDSDVTVPTEPEATVPEVTEPEATDPETT